MPTYSGIWEQGVVIDDTERSASETVYFAQNGDLEADALPVAMGFIQRRKQLFGHGHDALGAPLATAAPGTPGIFVLRLHDAFNKRLGKTWIFGRGDHISTVVAPDPTVTEEREELPADPVFNTMHVRFNAGVTLAGPPPEDLFEDRVYQFKAIPDGLTVMARRATTGTASVRFNSAWNALRAYMLANGYGMLMQSTATPNHKRDLTKSEFVTGTGKALVTVAGGTSGGITGIEDGDLVRISGANAKGWNGEYRVQIHGDPALNRLELLQGPREGQPLFTAATLQRLRSGTGTQAKIFAPFQKGEIVRISNTRANAPFVPFPGRKSRRRRKLPKWASALVASS